MTTIRRSNTKLATTRIDPNCSRSDAIACCIRSASTVITGYATL